MTEKKKSFLAAFEITDEDSCKKAIRNGGIAALISAGITAVFGIIGLYVQTTDSELGYFLDPWLLVDVVLILVLAAFVFRKSRVASTVLVIYFVASKLMFWFEVGTPKGLFVSLIFLLFYVTAMRGTYLWHGKYKDTDVIVPA